ncbi:MAG TPA: SDR family oxidoreductase [Ignavibacteria bacterium]|nr:SDR family oxidoreductase [Ignavibacteria bacterium]
MQKGKLKKKVRPPVTQKSQPGLEFKMDPRPEFTGVKMVKRLFNKTALITGGDSGIGRAVAVAFAREGCNVVIIYLNEHKDADRTKFEIEKYGQKCILIPGDIRNEKFCRTSVNMVFRKFNRLDILVNNAAVQFPQASIENISVKQLHQTFETNIFSYFYFTKASLKYMKEGSVVINTTSVTAYRGSPELIDYSSTKGAIVSFTRSLSASLTEKGIRVNAVAPGPVWTPLIPSTFESKKVSTFGTDVPMGKAAQPEDIAPCFVFLASDESKFISGQVLHPNGGEIVNG